MAVQHYFGIPYQQRGVSLIEQIMVLAIVAVLTGIAAPPLRKLLTRNELQVAQMEVIAALQHARETAITSGKHTLFCPSRDGSHCSNEARWDNGWLLGHDTNHDNQPDGGPLYGSAGYHGRLTIRSSASRRLVRFRPDGSASGSNLTLLFCHPASPDHALSVVVSNSGRIRGAPADANQTASCAVEQ